MRSRITEENVDDPVLKQAINQFPGLFVVAAGNNNNIDIYHSYPANYSKVLNNVITVGALDYNNEITSFSNYGSPVDIYAPGQRILSSYPLNICNNGGCSAYEHFANGYHYLNGTSMAAPYVSGVAALMLSENPKLTGRELKALILKSADEITINIPSESGGMTTQRVKKLNAYNAVKYVDTSDSYNVVFFETTHIPEGYQSDTQVLWLRNGDPWPATVNIPTAPFGYEFPGYFYKGDYSPDYNFTIYFAGGNFCNLNRYFKQEKFDAYEDIVLQARWTPKIYHFGIGMKHSADPDRENVTLTPSKNYEESYSYSMAEENTVNGVTKGFSRWELVIKNYTTEFLSMEYSRSTTLEFEVKFIIDNYCRNYEELGKPGIYFFSIYDVDMGGSCIAPGSMITLADGTLKAVEELTGDEMLLVWDMETGSFTSAPILFIDVDKPK